MKKKPNKKEPKKVVIKKKVDNKQEPIPSPFQQNDLGRNKNVNVRFVNMTDSDVPAGLKDALDAFTKTLKEKGGHILSGAEIGVEKVGTRGKFDFGTNKGLGGLAKLLDSYVNDFNCGNPDCPIHGSPKKSKPWDEAKFNNRVEEMRRITKGEVNGFVVMGVSEVNGAIMDVKGSDFIHGMNPKAVLLSIAQGLKITRKDMHELAEEIDNVKGIDL